MNPSEPVDPALRELEALARDPGDAAFTKLMSLAVEVWGRTKSPAALIPALQSAARRGNRQAVGSLLQHTEGVDASALPEYARVFRAAAKKAPATELAALVDRLRVAGPQHAAMVATLADALTEAGSPDLARQTLKLIDPRTLDAAAVGRLRRFARPDSSAAAGKQDVRVYITGLVTLDPLVPDVVVVAYDLNSLAPELVSPRRTEPERVDAVVAAALDQLGAAIRAWRSQSSSPVLIPTVLGDGLRRYGFLDPLRSDGARAIRAKVNDGIIGLAASIPGVHLLDLEQLAAEVGEGRFRDDRRRLFGRFPFGSDGMTAWGVHAADFIQIVRRGPKKVIVSDLDGTMWHGIVGDVGPEGVDVGNDFPGNAYREYQRTLLDFKAQGIVLCLCSKNDEDVALRVFREHRDMIIRLDDLVAWRIGWGPKPVAIRELAEQLNLGLDSFVFLDDSIHERAAVREALPQVLVPELPDDPVLRPAFLRSLCELWPLTLTETDLTRTAQYQAERHRDELRAEAGNNLDKFLTSLEQVLRIRTPSAGDWGRLAQMHQRTNQFNMTTRRYDEAALRKFHEQGYRIYLGSLADRFGDQGVIIAAVVAPEGNVWRLDTFLMSCRVFGRLVERAFIAHIAAEARAAGASKLLGEYIATERNHPYAHGFQVIGFTGPEKRPDSPDSEWWTLDVTRDDLRPDVVRVIAE
jgi:FkbH-like protein